MQLPCDEIYKLLGNFVDPDLNPDSGIFYQLRLTWGLMGENILNAYNLETVADRDIVTINH